MDKMLDEIMMPKRAATIMDLAQVKKGEKVLILCDYTTAEIGKRLVSQTYQMDALPLYMVIPPLPSDGIPVPEPVAAMAMQVDIIIAPMSVNIAHLPLRTEALGAGIRLLILPEITEEILASGLFDVDFNSARVKCEKMAELLGKAKTARVTTAKGTDITMSLEGREGQSQSGFAVKGVLAGPPSMEALCCPIEGTAEGKFVGDVCILGLPAHLYFRNKLLSEPVEVTVSKGLVREITGGREAKLYKEFMKSLNDPTVYTVAELGVGMNPYIKTFDGSPLDEAVVGSIHIGLGENWCFPGGTLRSSVHHDFIISEVTLELDNKVIIENGKQLL